jgi:UDP-N-acetylglucosamine--N-acetylmuramyl-(pentapeptide) pyrophosphoryl-undecaprenol N-acetylglucosamine transferase
MQFIRVQGLRGNGLVRWLLAPFKLLLALLQALRVVIKLRPNVVLGMGGFASGPGGLAAWLMRRPLVIHEQNAAPGLTNRMLAKIATTVLEAFPHSLANAQLTGNPVRESITKLALPAERYAQRQDDLRILILGGSQGAMVLNQMIPLTLAQVSKQQSLQVWHQCGERHLEASKKMYADASVHARVVPFIDDMAEAYAWADLVICRAGALTIAELAAAGVASLLVPFPHAVDDHQTKNAQWLAENDAAILMPQSQCSVESLADSLQRLFVGGRTTLTTMAVKARQLAKPEATIKVAEHCLEVACV